MAQATLTITGPGGLNTTVTGVIPDPVAVSMVTEAFGLLKDGLIDPSGGEGSPAT